jgi:hypothetical protein
LKNDHVSREIVEVRSRLTTGWDTVSFDVNTRLHMLRRAIGEADHPEIRRHIPVSAIAALQTMAKGLVVDLIKIGEPYRTRAGGLLKERIAIKDAIEWFHGEAFTFGEVVAHALTFNSMTDVHTVVESLLGVDLKRRLSTAVDPYHLRNGVKGAQPIVQDVDVLYGGVQEVFRIRHILAHEAAPNFEVSKADANRMLDSVILLVTGIGAVLCATAYADLPLTTYEMNVHAASKLQAARERLAAVVARTRDIAERNGDDASWFTGHQARWQALCDEWFQQTYGKLDGTMWTSVSALEEKACIEDRIKQLTQWNASQVGDELDHPDHPAYK